VRKGEASLTNDPDSIGNRGVGAGEPIAPTARKEDASTPKIRSGRNSYKETKLYVNDVQLGCKPWG